jgi:phage shock protein C
MSRRHRHSDRFDDIRHDSLRLDPGNRKIGGVCAGLGRYLDIQTVFVRVAAVLGLIIVPHVTLTAYVLMYLVLDSEA